MSDISEFLSDYSEDIATIAKLLKSHLDKLNPEPTETLHRGWKCIVYKHQVAFCAIAPHKKWVNLQFHAGAELHDPTQILTGTGKMMRHVRIGSADDISPEVIALIHSASMAAQ